MRALGQRDVVRFAQVEVPAPGAQVDLTLSEFGIVRFRAFQAKGDVTYRQIYDVVRGKDFAAGYGTEGFRANVRSFIKRIRKKFRDAGAADDPVHTEYGIGYRWRADDT